MSLPVYIPNLGEVAFTDTDLLTDKTVGDWFFAYQSASNRLVSSGNVGSGPTNDSANIGLHAGEVAHGTLNISRVDGQRFKIVSFTIHNPYIQEWSIYTYANTLTNWGQGGYTDLIVSSATGAMSDQGIGYVRSWNIGRSPNASNTDPTYIYGIFAELEPVADTTAPTCIITMDTAVLI